MVAQIDILALVQKLKGVRVVDRPFRIGESHRLQHLVYNVQNLKQKKLANTMYAIYYFKLHIFTENILFSLERKL